MWPDFGAEKPVCEQAPVLSSAAAQYPIHSTLKPAEAVQPFQGSAASATLTTA